MEVTIASPLSVLLFMSPGLSTGLTNNQLVLIIAIVGITALMLISTRRRLRAARNSPRAYAREQVARLRDERSVVQNMELVMSELERFSRETLGRIDTRFAKLEAVIRDADERIDRLERLLRRAEGSPNVDVTVDDAVPPVTPVDGVSEDPRRQMIYALADAGKTPVQIAEETTQSVGEIELILALRKTCSVAR